jgi:hypothetical protein
VHHLVGELNHPDPEAKLMELDPPNGLGEQICKLILCVDVARLEAPFLQAASNDVVPPRYACSVHEKRASLLGPERTCCPP